MVRRGNDCAFLCESCHVTRHIPQPACLELKNMSKRLGLELFQAREFISDIYKD